MPQSSGAHGEADATEQKNESKGQPHNTASTDTTLNARAKSPKTQGPKKWAYVLVAVIAVIAIIIGVTAFRNHSESKNENGTSAKADTVTVGLKLSPVSLDIRQQSGAALEQILDGNVYEGLVSRDSNNKVQPSIAKSWDISKNGKTYTFHLNDKMNFSNGHKLDSADVVWSINQLIEKQYLDSDAIESVSKVEAVDADTVKMTLSEPDSNLLWNLTGRPGLVFDKDAKYDAKTQAVGSGPYTVESFDPGNKIVLKANAKYWGTAHKAQTNKVVVRFFSDDNAAVNALKSGDVDVLLSLIHI